MPSESSNCGSAESPPSANKRPYGNALELGPRKRPYVGLSVDPVAVSMIFRTAQDPLVHHGRHFGRVVHTFCNVQTLITNGIALLGESEGEVLELSTAQ